MTPLRIYFIVISFMSLIMYVFDNDFLDLIYLFGLQRDSFRHEAVTFPFVTHCVI